jgi:hypothetical protein
MSRTRAKERPDREEDGLIKLAAELGRRRDRIVKIQRARSVLVGAYDLVTADLRAARNSRSGR